MDLLLTNISHLEVKLMSQSGATAAAWIDTNDDFRVYQYINSMELSYLPHDFILTKKVSRLRRRSGWLSMSRL